MRPLLPKQPREEEAPVAKASTAEPTKRKRHQVSVACDNCRKRKVKCDSRRPACSPCIQSSAECHFTAPEDSVQRDATLLQLRQVAQDDNHLRTILDLLHRSPRQESDRLLSRIREAPSVNEFIDTFADASLLVPDAAPHGSDTNNGSTDSTQ